MVPIKTDLADHSNYGGKRTQKVEWIVMHYTANDGDTDESNARYFKHPNIGASAHYFVDDDSITLSVPEDYVAWHCGTKNGHKHPTCRNANSIGIEMCDTRRDGTVMVTEKTIENAAELARMLCEKYNIPVDHIIRHYDVTGKLCPAYWVNNDGLLQFRKKVEEDMNGEEIYKKLNEYLKTLDAPDWAKDELEQAKAMGITDGTKPMTLIPRYQAAIMCKRAVEAAKK